MTTSWTDSTTNKIMLYSVHTYICHIFDSYRCQLHAEENEAAKENLIKNINQNKNELFKDLQKEIPIRQHIDEVKEIKHSAVNQNDDINVSTETCDIASDKSRIESDGTSTSGLRYICSMKLIDKCYYNLLYVSDYLSYFCEVSTPESRSM